MGGRQGALGERRGARSRAPLSDWEIGLAFMTYAAASAADYLMTLSGLMSREIRELNPILRSYVESLGAEWGLLLPKLLLGVTVVLTSTLYLRAMHRQRRTRVRPELILYAGALFTALAPLNWVLLKAWHAVGL